MLISKKKYDEDINSKNEKIKSLEDELFNIKSQIQNRREFSNIIREAVDKGYKNLTDDEKINLNQKIQIAFPEVTLDPIYGDNREDFLEKVFKGEFYKRYIDTFNIIEGSLNSILYNTQFDQFRIGIDKIFDEEDYDAVVIFKAGFGWNIELKQRPQHLAEALADKKVLYLYKSLARQDEDVYAIKQIKSNLYVVNLEMKLVRELIFEAIEKRNIKNKFVHVYATGLYYVPYEDIKGYMDKGFKVLYDFVDELSEEISGIEVTDKIKEDHNKLLSDIDNVLVVSTAEKLKCIAQEVRKTDKWSVLAPNGVNLLDFKNLNSFVGEKIKSVVEKNKPIIGYYGALASWFDYSKIKQLAMQRKNYEIVLIGFDYDGTLEKSGILELENVSYLGIIEYNKLIKEYACYFDVAMIPFIKNDITDSTSPVKLFEYMALEKPIVTTDINECKKYKSCLIASSNEQFVELVDKALELKINDEYIKTLRTEANENTWDHRAMVIKDEMLK
ncbi:MAG: glycosyltransferase [Sarcina sp.]